MPKKNNVQSPPLKEMLKSVPGVLGIRLDEEPKFEQVEDFGAFEVRDYPRMTLASVSMQLPHDEFAEKAFKTLADFIFTNDIEMTIPVFKSLEGNVWTMSFVLPHGFRAKNTPAPNHAAIKIEEVKAHRVVVHSFSGNVTEEKMMDAMRELTKWVGERAGYVPTGQACWAQYDQPATIPFLKRNEVMMTVKS